MPTSFTHKRLKLHKGRKYVYHHCLRKIFYTFYNEAVDSYAVGIQAQFTVIGQCIRLCQEYHCFFFHFNRSLILYSFHLPSPLRSLVCFVAE